MNPPAVHPTISENERNYIECSIADHKIEVTVWFNDGKYNMCS